MKEFIDRCLELARSSRKNGEGPFSCVIVKEGEINTESEDRAIRDNDIGEHAECVAMSIAQKLLNTTDLSDCTRIASVKVNMFDHSK